MNIETDIYNKGASRKQHGFCVDVTEKELSLGVPGFGIGI